MAIRYKLGLIVGGLSFIILAMFAMTWYTTSAQKADGLVINLAGRQRMLSQKMSKDLFLISIVKSDDERKKLITSVENSMKIFDTTLNALIDSGKAPVSLDLSGKYAQCPKAAEPALSQLLKVKKTWDNFSMHMKKALASDIKNTSHESMAYIKKNNLKLLGAMNKAVGMMQHLSEKKVSRLIIFQTIGVIFGLALMGISILQITTIVKKLMASASVASKMSRGDLTMRFPGENKPESKLDELGFLGHNLNLFAESLQDNMKGIASGAVELNDFSTTMHKVALDLSNETDIAAEKIDGVASNAENMSHDMNTVAAAMEELSTNTQLIAESTSRMTETIKAISKNTDEAREISHRAVSKVESASSRVDDLGNAAQKIGRVSDTITDISEQTNLLALNATIEAARAGEAGKGFAVVAGEIKHLASQTAEATEKIKSNIDWIQNSTKSTVEDIREVVAVINEVNEIVNNISMAVDNQTQTISEIDTNVSQGAQAVQEITENVANTSAASVSISDDISALNVSIGQVSSNSTDIASSADQLSGLAEKLKSMVSQFEV